MERWFALLTEKPLRRGVHESNGKPEAAIYRYLDVINEDPKPFVWTKTADRILANLSRFYQRTLDTGHQERRYLRQYLLPLHRQAETVSGRAIRQLPV